ncbi:odorant receptor 30a-like [Phlebotomus argentipes]|uniref:odorant receptor 30a-like n=1 Tax=Phlebotomus argentipes TaxID=94469 RepID=UPI00289372F4|nr:odorant receptor 30a-like [Phlebotomus argentipes]
MAGKAFTVAESRKYTVSLLRMVGFDVFVQKVPRTFIYYFCYWVNTSYHIFCLYTFIKHRRDIMIVLQCLSVWGAAGQCSVKTILALIYRKTMRQAFTFLAEKQEKSEEDPEIHAGYLKWSRRLNMIQKTIFYVLNNNIVLLSLYVLLSIVFFGDRKHLLICNIPGLPFDTHAPFPSYEIHIFYQFIALCAGVYELIVLDGLFAFFVCNGAAVAETLLVMTKRMSAEIDQNKLTDDATTERIKYLVFLHREYMDYVSRLDVMYSSMLLIQFGSFALSGSVALYVGGSSDWFAIYGVVLTSFTQLFFYNLLGTILQTKNQQIRQTIFETSWLKMCEKNKRYILLMLQRSQTMKTITVGHLAPLNLETGMSIYKALYSYFLLLKDVFK